MLFLICLAIKTIATSSSINFRDYINVNSYNNTTSGQNSEIEIQNFTPTFIKSDEMWLVFKVIYESETPFFLYMNFDFIQKLNLKNDEDIMMNPEKKYPLNFSFGKTPLSSPTKDFIKKKKTSDVKEIMFIANNLDINIQTINNTLTYIFKLFHKFLDPFIKNNLTYEQALGVSTTKSKPTETSTHLKEQVIKNSSSNPINKFRNNVDLFLENSKYRDNLRSYIQKQMKDSIDNDIYQQLYDSQNYQIELLGLTRRLDVLSKNTTIQTNYITKNFNILVYNVKDSIKESGLTDNINRKKFDLSAYRIILNEIGDIINENANRIFKVEISNALVHHNIDNYLFNGSNFKLNNNSNQKFLKEENKNEFENIDKNKKIRMNKDKLKRKRRRAKKKIKTVGINESSNTSSNIQHNEIDLSDFTIKAFFKNNKTSKTSENKASETYDPDIYNTNIDIPKVERLVGQVLKENKGFLLQFDDSVSEKLEYNSDKVQIPENYIAKYDFFEFGLNKFDINNTVVLMFDFLSLIDLMLSTYFNILDFDDKLDDYNKNVMRNLISLKEEFTHLVRHFFEFNKLNEFIDKYENNFDLEKEFDEVPDSMKSDEIKMCEKYIKIVAYSILNDDDKSKEKVLKEIQEIQRENAKIPMFALNTFIMGIISRKLSDVINDKDSIKKYDEQLNFIFIDYIDIEISLRIKFASSEHYKFKNEGFDTNKNKGKNKTNVSRSFYEEVDYCEALNLNKELNKKRQLLRCDVDKIKHTGNGFDLRAYDKVLKYLSMRLFEEKEWQSIFYKLNVLLFGYMIEHTKYIAFLRKYIEMM